MKNDCSATARNFLAMINLFFEIAFRPVPIFSKLCEVILINVSYSHVDSKNHSTFGSLLQEIRI